MDMTDDLKSAIAYVREQLGEEELDVIRALRNKAALFREPIPADYSDKVYNLLEEWGEEHDLPEGWWANEADMEDILTEI